MNEEGETSIDGATKIGCIRNTMVSYIWREPFIAYRKIKTRKWKRIICLFKKHKIEKLSSRLYYAVFYCNRCGFTKHFGSKSLADKYSDLNYELFVEFNFRWLKEQRSYDEIAKEYSSSDPLSKKFIQDIYDEVWNR